MKRRNVFKLLSVLFLSPIVIVPKRNIWGEIQRRANEIYSKQGPQKTNLVLIQNEYIQNEYIKKEILDQYVNGINKDYYGVIKLNDRRNTR